MATRAGTPCWGFTAPTAPLRLLDEQALVDIDGCHRENKDVGPYTRGVGSPSYRNVAGTPQRQDALAYVIGLPHEPQKPNDRNLAAVLMREPENPADPRAVRVVVAGVPIGYLFREDAALWTPLLLECEKRQQILVLSVKINGGEQEKPYSASVRLRDSLPGFEGPSAQRRAAKKQAAAHRAAAARLLEGAERDEVVEELTRLAEQESIRSKPKAAIVVKQFRALLPLLTAHADALEAATSPPPPFVYLLSDAEGLTDDLVGDVEDADEREDLHDQLKEALGELAAALA